MSKTAVIYARYSPRPGNHSESADAQVAAGHKYAEFHNLNVIGAYKDEAISGKDAANRPQFQEAINLACKHKAVFVVYSLSRFARSTLDAILYARQLEGAGADLASLKEQIDTTTPTGRFTFRILSALAELEREQIAERTRDSMRHYQNTLNMRMSNVAKTPFGWKCAEDGKKLVPDEYEQAVLARILHLRKTGSNYSQIIAALFREKLLTRQGPVYRVNRQGRKLDEIIAYKTGMFHHSTIRQILDRAGVE
jgi:site-specific DNA recombinase